MALSILLRLEQFVVKHYPDQAAFQNLCQQLDVQIEDLARDKPGGPVRQFMLHVGRNSNFRELLALLAREHTAAFHERGFKEDPKSIILIYRELPAYVAMAGQSPDDWVPKAISSRQKWRQFALIALAVIFVAGLAYIFIQDRSSGPGTSGYAEFTDPPALRLELETGWQTVYHEPEEHSAATLLNDKGKPQFELILYREEISGSELELIDNLVRQRPMATAADEEAILDHEWRTTNNAQVWFGRYPFTSFVSPFSTQRRYETLVMRFEAVSLNYILLDGETLLHYNFITLQEYEERLEPLAWQFVQNAGIIP